MLRFTVLKIRSSEHTTFRVEAAAWEVPLLQAVHADEEGGPGNVEEIGDFLVDREAPNAADEFKRLADRYKKLAGADVSVVASVYGQFNGGVSGLARAIADATVDGEASAPPDAVEPPADVEPVKPAAKVTKGKKGAAKAEAPASDLL